MTETAAPADKLPPLSKMSDAELKRLQDAVAAEREKRRQNQLKEAEERIRKLAAEAGLSVAIRERRKPGRKRKRAATG